MAEFGETAGTLELDGYDEDDDFCAESAYGRDTSDDGNSSGRDVRSGQSAAANSQHSANFSADDEACEPAVVKRVATTITTPPTVPHRQPRGCGAGGGTYKEPLRIDSIRLGPTTNGPSGSQHTSPTSTTLKEGGKYDGGSSQSATTQLDRMRSKFNAYQFQSIVLPMQVTRPLAPTCGKSNSNNNAGYNSDTDTSSIGQAPCCHAPLRLKWFGSYLK